MYSIDKTSIPKMNMGQKAHPSVYEIPSMKKIYSALIRLRLEKVHLNIYIYIYIVLFTNIYK